MHSNKMYTWLKSKYNTLLEKQVYWLNYDNVHHLVWPERHVLNSLFVPPPSAYFVSTLVLMLVTMHRL